MRTAAILPVKRFSGAKQRLGASVAETLRLQLAQAMVGDVLTALAGTEALEMILVVTREPAVAAAARHLGAIVVSPEAEEGQSAAVGLGIERALGEGAQRALCVPGDCPALDPTELTDLLAQESEGGVVIMPDRHGTGTNGLLLAPPAAIAPSFGPDSCERHRQLAAAAGLPCRVHPLPSLLLDVDTGQDLTALRERLSGEQVWARRTRAVLQNDGEQTWEASPSAA